MVIRGGTKTRGCQLEWYVADATLDRDRRGFPKRRQTCTDSTTHCDFDNVLGQCTFKTVLCLNNDDGSLTNSDGSRTCMPNGIQMISVPLPVAKSTDSNNSNIQNAYRKLLNPLNPCPTPVAMCAPGQYVYGVPLQAGPTPAPQVGFCSAPFDLVVKLNGRPKQSLRVKAISTDVDGNTNVSKLKLTCLE